MTEPDRILPLLWRRTHPLARAATGRRPRLAVDDVVAAAIGIADVDGLDALSMNRVAEALGVGTMTLYSYVASKAELLDLMVDDVLAERALPGPGEERPQPWREQVALYAERTRTMYRRHPWLRNVPRVRPPIGPGMLAEREYVLSTLDGTDLQLAQLDPAALAITAMVTSAAAAEAESAETERRSGQSNDDWWGERTALWDDYFDVDAHPTMTRIWNASGFETSTVIAAAHTFGLERLLDGIEALGAPVDNFREPQSDLPHSTP